MDDALGFSTGRFRRGLLGATLLVPLAFALLAVPLILRTEIRGRGASDSINYHEKAIRTFAEQLPHPDLSDYLSATTPGYHLLLALFARVVHAETQALQLVGMLFTVALLATLGSACAWRMRRTLGALGVVALCLPMVTSLYVLSSGVWLLPDNAAWWALVSVMLLALRRSQNVSVWALAGVALLALVLFRQIHLWAAGLVWLGAFLGAGAARPPTPLLARVDLGGLMVPRLARTSLALLFTIPAFLILAAFASLWGGLTPPTFNTMHGLSIRWATPPFLLSLFALLGAFYLPFWWPGLRQLWHEQPALVLATPALALTLTLFPETTHDPTQGRVSGLWHLVKEAPVLAGHTSIIVLALAPTGALVILAWLRAMNPRSRWIMLAAVVGFAVANSANPQLWQRYHEPFVLLWCILASSLSVWSGTRPEGLQRRLAVLGPVTLAVLLALVSARGIFWERPATDGNFRPGHVEPSLLRP